MQIEIVNSSHENGFERHKAREIKMPKVLRHIESQKAARRQTKSDTTIGQRSDAKSPIKLKCQRLAISDPKSWLEIKNELA